MGGWLWWIYPVSRYFKIMLDFFLKLLSRFINMFGIFVILFSPQV